MEDFVGLRGDSGLLSSLIPFKYVGDMSGFEISMARSSGTLRPPPRKSFLVENLRARLEPVVVVVVLGVGKSGVGRGYL